MPEELRLWRIDDNDRLQEISRASLDLEGRIETWINEDISILDSGLLVIGRQIATDLGGYIDLLCIDQFGDLVVVELKRDKSPRQVTAQILEYGSFVANISSEQVFTLAASTFSSAEQFTEAFIRTFSKELPATLNESHQLLLVAATIDPSSERIIKYLSEVYGVKINAATFHYFRDQDGREFLARNFLIDPEEERQNRARIGERRRRNLSIAELEAIADQNGVGELFRYAVSQLDQYLSKQTTQTSIAFIAQLDGRKKVILSFVPGQSNEVEGVRFQLYRYRLQKLLDIEENELLNLIPRVREYWIYYPSAPQDCEGFQGFIVNRDEIDQLVRGFAALGKRRATI